MLGSYIYITDKDTNKYFTNTWYPVMHQDQKIETNFKFGAVNTKTSYNYLTVETTKFIPDEFNGLVQLVKITNDGPTKKNLRLFSTESVNVGDARGIQFSGFNSLMMAGGFYDKEISALVWRNDFGIPCQSDEDKIKGLFGKVLCHVTSEKVETYSSRYRDFVGHYTNTMANPDGVTAETLPCTDAEDMCNALSVLATDITLNPGETKNLVFALIAADTEDYYCKNKKELKSCMDMISSYEKAEALYKTMYAGWEAEFGKLKLSLPGNDTFDHSFKWLQYQCEMVCCLNRMKSRFHSGFEYGFGFRDILQDMLALLPYNTQRVREFLAYTAEQMFSDGSVYHNFYVSAPGTTDFHACDDPLWLIYAVCEYVKETGDYAFLNEVVPFADKKEGWEDKNGSIYDHCKAALDRVWKYSTDGIPTMFDADWNDDLSGYPEHLSVMAAEMFYKALNDFAELCKKLPDAAKYADVIKDCETKANTVKENVNKYCIDSTGAYVRLLGPGKNTKESVGSADTDNVIFFEPTAWAGYSGIATKEQFLKSSEQVDAKLAAKGGVCICTTSTTLSEGKLPDDDSAYKKNAPGKKENGSFFRHLESWYVASMCRYGEGNKAWDLFYNTLPAVCDQQLETYSAEPFVYPEYVAGPSSQDYGRAGHTWLTGTAPTRQRVVVENIFGIQPDYDGLVIDPCVPAEWKIFSAVRRYRDTMFEISYSNPDGVQKGVKSITVDGKAISGNTIGKEFLDGKTHKVAVVMGA